MNVFSWGMDEMAAKLEAQGIKTTVANYILWESLADDAAKRYKSGEARTIVLVGHSSGATYLPDMIARLDRLGVPVSLAVGLDSVFQTSLKGRVGRYMNLYISNGVGTKVEKTAQLHGSLDNIDVAAVPGIGHVSIDKNLVIQRRVVSAITATVFRRPAAPKPTVSVEAAPEKPTAGPSAANAAASTTTR